MPGSPTRTAQNLHIPTLDGIRAAAVLLVFLAHAGLNDRLPGNFGVTVFFFLSGYLITTLLRLEADASGGVSFKAFYLRRALRILPPMYLVLIAASALTATHVLEGSLSWDALLAQMFHLSNYFIIVNGWWDGRAPGTWIYWSLAVEEHFYLVFPLVYLILRRLVPNRRSQFVLLIGVCAAVLMWRLLLVYGFDAPKDRTYVATDTRIDSILFGCALAVFGNPVLDKTRVSDRSWRLIWFPLGLIGLVLSYLPRDIHFEQTFRYSLQGVSLFPIFVSAIRFPNWFVFRPLNVRPIAFLGVLSYSFYLIHPTVLFGLEQWLPWPAWVRGSVGLGIVIAISTAIYYLVEQPCARLRKRLSRVNPSRADAPAVGTAPEALAAAVVHRERTLNVTHISVVICTRNRPDLIGNAVSSVLANTHPDFDVAVVDQSTDARTAEIVRSLAAEHSNLRYLHTHKAGLSRAYNIGIRETTGNIIAFTDDDCVAPSNWLSTIAAAFEAETSADLLYGQVLLPSALADNADDVPTLAIVSPWTQNRTNTPFRIYGMGANFAARRTLFDRIGGFDEVLGGGGPLKSSQDFDLQYRAYVAGMTTAYRPEVKVDHYGLRTKEQWVGTHLAYGTGDGAFYIKHVRCGDVYALQLLTSHLVRNALREVLHAAGIRRRYSRVHYIRGFLTGIAGGFRFGVDRRKRLYTWA
jgi:peptidoglycan/LPS O-acetylase OafA/YrhL/glycosyltransferase involved in cell wall biosynthesis